MSCSKPDKNIHILLPDADPADTVKIFNASTSETIVVKGRSCGLNARVGDQIVITRNNRLSFSFKVKDERDQYSVSLSEKQ